MTNDTLFSEKKISYLLNAVDTQTFSSPVEKKKIGNDFFSLAMQTFTKKNDGINFEDALKTKQPQSPDIESTAQILKTTTNFLENSDNLLSDKQKLLLSCLLIQNNWLNSFSIEYLKKGIVASSAIENILTQQLEIAETADADYDDNDFNAKDIINDYNNSIKTDTDTNLITLCGTAISYFISDIDNSESSGDVYKLWRSVISKLSQKDVEQIYKQLSQKQLQTRVFLPLAARGFSIPQQSKGYKNKAFYLADCMYIGAQNGATTNPALKTYFNEPIIKFYWENQDTIDKSYYKHEVAGALLNVKRGKATCFFNAFTDRLHDLAVSKFHAEDNRSWLSSSKDNPLFQQEAVQLFNEMLSEKEKYWENRLFWQNQHNNQYVRNTFPELFDKIDTTISTEPTEKELNAILAYAKRKYIYNEYRKKHNLQLPVSTEKLAQYNLSEEEFIRISKIPFNDDISPKLAKTDMPDWMLKITYNAISNGLISGERLPGSKDLFDACKAWKCAPLLRKSDAVKVGKMPLEYRMIAGGIAYGMYLKTFNQTKVTPQEVSKLWKEHPQLKTEFWQKMKEVQDNGIVWGLEKYVSNHPLNSERLVNMMPNLLEQEKKILSQTLSAKALCGLQTNTYHKVFNLILDMVKPTDDNEKSSISLRKAWKQGNDGNNILSGYDWIVQGSCAAAKIFGSHFPEYIRKTKDYLSVHDATYWLNPEITTQNSKAFADFLNKNIIYADILGKKHARQPGELKIISQNWNYLKPQDYKLPYKQLLAACKAKKYRHSKYPEFAEEAAKWGTISSVYKKYEQIYEQGLKVPEPFSTKVKFKKGGLTGRFLPRNDVRTGFFGHYTGCCQHFDGVGKQCAISTIKDPFSQLFVVENEKGEIVAGSWLWKSVIREQNENGKNQCYNGACFDNVEAKLSYKTEGAAISDIYKQAGQYLSEQNFKMVTIGKSLSDINLNEFSSCQSISLPPSYSGYSDSASQVMLAKNDNALPIDENTVSMYVCGATQEDIPAMQSVANRCFPDSDRQLSIPSDNPNGMLLVDVSSNRTVGYIIWDEKEKHIYDMAVLPEYRKGSNAASGMLLSEMMKHIKDCGGEWGADLREGTSMRYMKAMAGRNVIKMREEGVDHVMSDGSKVTSVKFEYIPEKDRPIPQRNSHSVSVVSQILQRIGGRRNA